MDRQNNPFLKSTPEIDRAIRETKSSSELREVLDQLMAQRGIYTRGQNGVFDNTADADRPNQPSVSSLPESTAPTGSRCMRVIYPSGQNRFELYGATEAELDSQEAAIRAMYR